MKITEESKKVFLAYAEDAGNWSGTPLVSDTKEHRGNLTQLKRAGLITTWKEEGNSWVEFTDKGIEYAWQNGIDLTWTLFPWR